MNSIRPIQLGTFAACQVFNIGGPGAPAMRAAVGFTAYQRLDVGDYRLTHESIDINTDAIFTVIQIAQANPANWAMIWVTRESNTQTRIEGRQIPIASQIDFNFYAIIRRWR